MVPPSQGGRLASGGVPAYTMRASNLAPVSSGVASATRSCPFGIGICRWCDLRAGDVDFGDGVLRKQVQDRRADRRFSSSGSASSRPRCAVGRGRPSARNRDARRPGPSARRASVRPYLRVWALRYLGSAGSVTGAATCCACARGTPVTIVTASTAARIAVVLIVFSRHQGVSTSSRESAWRVAGHILSEAAARARRKGIW